MRPSKAEVLERERRWAIPTTIAALAAFVLALVAVLVAANSIGGTSGEAELLRSIDQHRSAEMIASVMQALGVGLLAAPLLYLFRAAQARSETMRGQLVGVVVVAPLFLLFSDVISGISALHAAADFVAKGIVGTGDHANKVADDTASHASLRTLAAGFGLAGQLGFLVAMVYTCLHAMRVGLLTRFWGSLGIALGAVSILPLPPFYFFWFIFLALLIAGWLPNARPPAWAAGEAIPWPTPGEKAAATLGDGESEPPQGGDGASPEPSERRKRKQRG